MLLWPFVALTTFGFGVWITGALFEYTGIAAIGATLVIAVGGAVALTDLEARDGEVVEKSYTTINNSTVVNETYTTPTYSTVSIIEEFGGPVGHLSFGGLVMLVGGLLFTHTMNEVR